MPKLENVLAELLIGKSLILVPCYAAEHWTLLVVELSVELVSQGAYQVRYYDTLKNEASDNRLIAQEFLSFMTAGKGELPSKRNAFHQGPLEVVFFFVFLAFNNRNPFNNQNPLIINIL